MADDSLSFTGERLHDDDTLFGIDLLRHRAAYREAGRRARECGARRLLEIGSGAGYGAAELGIEFPGLVAVDRVAPPGRARTPEVRFLRADVRALPLVAASFDVVLSFQVIEHLENAGDYAAALARALADDGVAFVTTPNVAFSDGENPFHVHEYACEELRALLLRQFDSVEIFGVSARGEALSYHEARLERIRRVVRIDPLGLRHRLPSRLVEWLFGRAAVFVRRAIGAESALARVDIDDFPIGAFHDRCLDLFAVCRRPRR